MSDITSNLASRDLARLLAEGIREAAILAPTAWEPPAPEDLAGVLPQYEIIRLIGRGGMGAVYEARQVNLGRRVALKVLPPELGANEAFAERFRREARALGRLEHGNILEVFEFGESTTGHLFYSMQYVEGGDLGARLKAGPLPQGEALRLVKEICAALEAAHAQGVIHRDIKPSNILLTADGTVKVADFGIAVLDAQPQERLTFTGIAVGTLEYAAPEQAAGTAVDMRSDLYSLGVICYEVLTGQLPRGVFDPPSKVNPAVDPAVDEVVHTAMHSDPARRFQSATDFRAALSRSGQERARNSRWRLFAAAAVLVLAACVGIFHWLPKKQSTPAPAATAGIAPPSALDGPVIAWGSNENGECNVPAGLGSVGAIDAGDGFTAALKTDGTVVVWGRNDYGQTGVPAGLAGVQSIAAGSYHMLALKADGTVVAWGRDNYGQSAVPAGLANVRAIAAGNAFSLALKTDGTVVAWGANTVGQIDIPAGLSDVESIAAGEFHSLAVKRDGTIVVWGNPTFPNATAPANATGVRAAAGSFYQSLALKTDGTVIAWGHDYNALNTVPAGLSGVVAIAAGKHHNLVLKADGTVVAWGKGGASSQTSVPSGLAGVKAIAAGFRHNVVLK